MDAASAFPPPVFSIALVLMLVYTLGEFVYLAFIVKKAPFRSDFLQPLKSMAVWIVTLVSLSRVAPFLAVAGFAALGASLAPATLPEAWYSWVFALLIYEFWYWVQHFLAHKVRLLGTLVPLRDEEPVSYGITRPVNVESYLDVHFGEFSGLWADIKSTPGILNKLGYLFMPPGWSPTGDHKTVSAQQREWRLAMQAET